MPSGFAFDHVLFYGREYEEVLSMTSLAEADLAGRKILDCPSGPDAFVAGAAARGHDIVGCDPLYARPLGDIARQGREDITLARDRAFANAEVFHGMDIEAFHRRKFDALEEFVADYEPGRAAGRYLSASLPHLPFADKSFDLVISANLLFTYSSSATGGIAETDVLNLEFHRASVHELIRVCRGELRHYPVMTHGSKARLHPYVAQIVGQLAADGISMTFVESAYEQGKVCGHLVLVIDCAA